MKRVRVWYKKSSHQQTRVEVVFCHDWGMQNDRIFFYSTSDSVVPERSISLDMVAEYQELDPSIKEEVPSE